MDSYDEDQGKSLSRVTLHRPSELEAKPISWRIQDVIPNGMLTVLHARDKVGKTLLAWEAARSLLWDSLFLGTFAVTPGPDGKLKVRASAPLPEELREALRQRKAEVLALLSSDTAEEAAVATGEPVRIPQRREDVLIPWPCCRCGNPAEVEAVEPWKDDGVLLTYWHCPPVPDLGSDAGDPEGAACVGEQERAVRRQHAAGQAHYIVSAL